MSVRAEEINDSLRYGRTYLLALDQWARDNAVDDTIWLLGEVSRLADDIQLRTGTPTGDRTVWREIRHRAARHGGWPRASRGRARDVLAQDAQQLLDTITLFEQQLDALAPRTAQSTGPTPTASRLIWA